MSSDGRSAEDGFFQAICLLLFSDAHASSEGLKNSPYRYFSHVFKINFYGNYTQCKTEIISEGFESSFSWSLQRRLDPFPALFGFFIFYVAGLINNLILFSVVVATIMKRFFAMNKESW